MKLLEIARLISMVAVAWAFLCAQAAHAYLDPGTGSFIFQILAASFLGAMATIKMWWSSVANLFKGKPKNISEDSADKSPGQSESPDKQPTGV